MPRPANREQRRRRQAFLQSLSEVGTFAEAVSGSGIDERHLVRLLDEDEFWSVVTELRAGRVGPTAVVVDAAAEPRAA